MAEIRINATGGVKLYDADDPHYAQIIAGTISSNVDALTLGSSSATFNIPVTVGVDDTGKDVKFFGATASRYWLWDESADGVVQRGTLTVGVDDTGHDVKLFGASAGAYALWDESANLLDLRGATAAGPGNLKLTTGELTVVDADVLGKIEFQAPLEGSGTDAILVGAAIWAEADDTFAAGVNNTDLVFALGKSEAAAEKFRFTADTEIGIGGANYGTDGQVLTSGGAGAACAWEDGGGGITEADTWRLSSALTLDGSVNTWYYITSNWARCTGDGFGKPGTGLTESSGVFSFPSTGYWLIDHWFNLAANGGDTQEWFVSLHTTLDNSSYGEATFTQSSQKNTNYSTSSNKRFVFDVTNTTNCKFKFKTYYSAQNNVIQGDGGYNYSGFDVIKLADT